MSLTRRNSFLYVAGMHVAVIVAMILGGAFKGCAKKKKPEILAVVNIQPMAAVKPQPVAPQPPTPEPPKPPPEPVKPKPKLNTPEQIRERIKNKKKIVKRDVDKVEEKKADPKPEPKREMPTEDLIKKELFKDKELFDPVKAKADAAAAAVVDREMALILAQLKYQADAQWQQPVGLSSSAGQITSITFTINRSGQVIQRKFKQRSGIAELDQSAMQAAERINFVKAFPAACKLAEEDFTIEFELTQ